MSDNDKLRVSLNKALCLSHWHGERRERRLGRDRERERKETVSLCWTRCGVTSAVSRVQTTSPAAACIRR